MKYTIDIEDKFVPFLEPILKQENLTMEIYIKQLMENTAKSRIDSAYQAKENNLTIDEKINAIS